MGPRRSLQVNIYLTQWQFWPLRDTSYGPLGRNYNFYFGPLVLFWGAR